MSRLVLKAILGLGRYAVLPVVALAGAMIIAWLMALDRYTISALATAPLVLFVGPVAIALALGLVLLPSRRDRTSKVDEGTAPGLWAIWNELDGAFSRSHRTLRIDADFNASISEASRHAGLFKPHVTMTVGLPLLIVLDERAIRAVIAHEVAHARLQHTTGGANLSDFIAASQAVLLYANPDRTITGRIAHALLHSALKWLEKEYRALSRENELCADGDAAKQVGRGEMARSLVLLEGGKARLADLVFTPLEKEMLGATKVPKPPFQRIFDQLDDVRAPEPLATAALAGMTREHEPDSTHPSFAKRLANLGFTDVPTIDKPERPAVEQLLTREAATEFVARFDQEWRKTAERLVRMGG